MSWALEPLLEVRRRDEARATAALGRALARGQAVEAEAGALRAAAGQVAAWARRAGPGAACGHPLLLVSASAWAARLRIERVRLGEKLAEAEARTRAGAAEIECRRASLRHAALRRQVVERLEAAWRRDREAAAARRADAALDDRPMARRRG